MRYSKPIYILAVISLTVALIVSIVYDRLDLSYAILSILLAIVGVRVCRRRG
jgi:cytochrome c oxidase subunit IV